MDFQLTEEQVLIRDMVREFVENEIKPIAGAIDKEHRFPSESVAPMAELGLFGFNIDEAYGGTEADAISYVLATEEMAKVSASHAMIMGSQCSLTGPIIQKYADEATKARILPGVVSGEKLGCFCLSEPSAGCDAAAQETTAVRQGDNYVINGSKLWITAAPQGAFFIVFAMTDKSKGVKGITAFLVERDNPGISIGLPEDKMGMNGSETCSVSFSDCVVPASAMLGEEGKGFNIAMETLDGGRLSCSALALGIAQSALDATITYTKERIQFGKPIAANQGIQWVLVDMATRVDCARMLVYRAAAAKMTGLPYTRESAQAKLYAAEAATYVTQKAVQLHGGMGYTKSYPVERLMREAKLTEIFEGTSEVQRMVIAKHILA
ncbi:MULTISPECIES: acyl-CoA dehydrogenase family protein [Enterobacterales]|uniref:acyl-CoA dehydrogenase family protein n=1 Tax=Enterobacterales TaxID=91347 RepID=UPI000847DDC9|nr:MULTISPECIES: acyl-CoA dehydrogenase family protein [Enterobacterales]WOO49328.1 acyl-CoA dehydrogenase family protein [Hafnia alvei]ODQ03379.1 acyl-CoA dehydrogenase [Shigella sp. FC130]OEI93149.1 acyl-CoA dehydrogenase [Shigella sp. FC1655]OEJ07568.1 acyl-CoA dehydrogenase [Shigella sp. FC1967]WPF03794.1 acyl-CoA dehydrogenase family protein [Proteus vulgaris]